MEIELTGEHAPATPFQAQLELLRKFLTHRDSIVGRMHSLVDAQRSSLPGMAQIALLTSQIEDCFFTQATLTVEQRRMKDQLRDLHWASGFRPLDVPGVHNDLVDPAQMLVRASHLWQQSRWPGRAARLQFAHTLYCVYLLRSLVLLSMRAWDEEDEASSHLAQIQEVLDELWTGAPGGVPVLVRDAHWLIPLAQSPTTEQLGPYFEIAARVARSLVPADRLEIHKAAVVMAGGHLRSQLRHYCIKHGVSLAEEALILNARHTNALDFAILIQNLVPLLEAYEETIRRADTPGRLSLAGAILQGLSSDPELFIVRTDLMSPYTMIEPLFISTGLDAAQYTAMGTRHVELLRIYATLIDRLVGELHADCRVMRPQAGSYSPLGLIYGFSSNIFEHMVLRSAAPDSTSSFSLEDAFTEGTLAKRDWVGGWRKLPHVSPQVQQLFEYPEKFAGEIFERLTSALSIGANDTSSKSSRLSGHLNVQLASTAWATFPTGTVASLEIQFIASSDRQMIAARRAHYYDEASLLRDRNEGMFLVSYPTSGGWTAISKDVLTRIIGTGSEAMLELPAAAAAQLRLMCVGLEAVRVHD